MMPDAPMSLERAIHERRAVRSYQPHRLAQTTIHHLLAAAVQAPTAVRLEPWAFVVIQDPALLRRYSDKAKALSIERAARYRTEGAHAEGHIALLEDPKYNIFYDAGTLIVICGRPLGPLVSADCWLAAENLMLTACAIGLGTCCVGFAIELLNQPEIKAELDIPADVTAVAPIIVGLPRAVPRATPRQPPVILSWKL
jgi:nitroreductase